MASNDPLQAATDAAARIRDQVLPKIKDRFAEVPKPGPAVSLGRLMALPDAQAKALLKRQIARHGEAAVERKLRAEGLS